MEKRNRVLLIVAIVMVCILGLSFVANYENFVHNGYPVQKGTSYLKLSERTNNLTKMVMYINDSEHYFYSFHGNPAWWFPVSQTSWGTIEHSLNSTKQEALAYQERTNISNIGGISYQLELNSLKGSIVKIQLLVSDNLEMWQTNSESIVIMNLLVLLLFSFGLMVITTCYINSFSSVWNQDRVGDFTCLVLFILYSISWIVLAAL